MGERLNLERNVCVDVGQRGGLQQHLSSPPPPFSLNPSEHFLIGETLPTEGQHWWVNFSFSYRNLKDCVHFLPICDSWCLRVS